MIPDYAHYGPTTPTTRKTAESPPPSLGAPSKAGQFLWSHHGNSWSNSKNHSLEIPKALRMAYSGWRLQYSLRISPKAQPKTKGGIQPPEMSYLKKLEG